MQTPSDDYFLNVAIRLSQEHMAIGDGGPFGAVVVHQGTLVAEGWNQVTTHLDPTAHAEVVAIRNAASALKQFSLKGCTLYTSCEPCPMCLAAAYWARIDRIVFGASRADAAAAGFDDAFLYEELSRPSASRQIPMVQMLTKEAQCVLEAWKIKLDKVPY